MPPSPSPSSLPPLVEGAWVKSIAGSPSLGRVVECRISGDRWIARVDWFDGGVADIALDQLCCGLQPGFVVQDVPSSIVRETLGPLAVVAVRKLAGSEQALVQVHRSGRLLWLPHGRLKRIMDPKIEFLRGELQSGAAERLVLKLMGHALRNWNDSTGALDRLDIDPLPHQIQLVHRILTSGRTNWIIADDVGLGKTIEVGLLLAGLERRERLRRVLIVTPASLTRQWQDEMRVKFDKHYEIYGEDFLADEPWKWKLHDRVIASLDLLKPTGRESADESPSHFERLLLAEPWDLVIFDEAHRLSRTEHGRTLRYELALALRSRSDNLLLLTGTPHQGDQERFRHLLQLVRPDLAGAIATLQANPEAVGEIILRNRKLDVTDADGKFIFNGQSVLRYEVQPAEDALELERKLSGYFKQGYGAGERIGGARGRAVGFVMTTYRKLASSSYYALRIALERRMARLSAEAGGIAELPPPDVDSDDPDLYQPQEAAAPFFASEGDLLKSLIARCNRAIQSDRKIRHLIQDIIQPHVVERGEKIIIFTEYRDTQNFIAEMLSKLLGAAVAVVNGSQSLSEKMSSVADFENDVPILISTEAGGEGFNLHRRCHVMVNYDLPWNPAKLVQRIGRIYRYGQTRRVVVFNLHSRDTVDSQVLGMALEKVQAIAREMAPVGEEFRERYEADILGDLLEQLDLSEVMDRARREDLKRSEERIASAVERARVARELQQEVLSHATRFDPGALQRLGGFSTLDLARFVVRSCKLLHVEIEVGATDAERLTIRLTETMRGRFPEFQSRSVVEATTNRARWDRTSRLHLLDFSSTFVQYLIEEVTSPEFGGGFATLVGEIEDCDFVGAFLARTQTDQGDPLGEELLMAVRGSGAAKVVGNGIVRALFQQTFHDGTASSSDPAVRNLVARQLQDAAEEVIAGQITSFIHPNDLIPLAYADIRSRTT